MSDPESFVARWSRLKREALEKPSEVEPAPPQSEEKAAPEEEARAPSPQADPSPRSAVDLESLPPIESITSTTDIQAFLQSGVPADLTREALRRVWTSDPAIRDFIGLAENQWDFTDPGAMPGFGPLEDADNVSELVAQALGKLSESAPVQEELGVDVPDASPGTSSATDPVNLSTPPQVLGMPAGNEMGGDSVLAVEEHKKIDSAALQHDVGSEKDRHTPNRRAHGRALPR
ncbi:MAG: DUF3306 domain-containing protein [Hyphomicrobiaceae bacterium]